jgi:hypothetical protein
MLFGWVSPGYHAHPESPTEKKGFAALRHPKARFQHR